ncbi:MAG: transcriptional repressor LexA [Sphaerochaetaceae bacterium]
MKGITDRQKEVATFIGQFIKENGYSPSVRDVAEHFGFSVKAAHDHLRALERKDIIRTAKGISRSIEVLQEGYPQKTENIEVPVLGTIAAGLPLLSEENVDYNLSIPSTMLHGAKDTYFALHVRGSSMIDDGIFDGDIVILKQSETAERGEIVAASVEDDDNGGITLKEFYPAADHVELRPANQSMGPIITRACHIHGKLVLLVRSYL